MMKKQIVLSALGWLLLVLLLAALCFVTASAWVLAALLLCVTLPLASFGLNFALRGKLHLSLSLPTSTAKKTAVSVTAELRNEGFFPALRVFVPIQVQNDLTGEQKQFEIVLSAGAKSSRTSEFLLESGYCGRLSLRVDKLWIMDYFGFLPVKAALTASARTTVLPDMFPSEVSLTPSPAVSDEGTESRRGPDRSEVFQLREYRPGDDVRQIHWKLSSKLDELIWKEPSMPESRSLLIAWDKRVQAAPNAMDAMAEAVSSVCQGILHEGVPFELCWTEEEPHTCWIENEDELLRVIPALVKSAGKADCPMPSFDNYGSVLYFGTQLPGEEPDSRVKCLLCGDAAGREGQVYSFSPENMRETLRRLEM